MALGHWISNYVINTFSANMSFQTKYRCKTEITICRCKLHLQRLITCYWVYIAHVHVEFAPAIAYYPPPPPLRFWARCRFAILHPDFENLRWRWCNMQLQVQIAPVRVQYALNHVQEASAGAYCTRTGADCTRTGGICTRSGALKKHLQV